MLSKEQVNTGHCCLQQQGSQEGRWEKGTLVSSPCTGPQLLAGQGSSSASQWYFITQTRSQPDGVTPRCSVPTSFRSADGTVVPFISGVNLSGAPAALIEPSITYAAQGPGWVRQVGARVGSMSSQTEG